MKPSIYDQHDKAFRRVSAFVIARNGERVATIAFNFPRDGAGRLYCYLQWMGAEMVRGYASGGGYDKKSAAAASAAQKLGLKIGWYADGTPHHSDETWEAFAAFKNALIDDNGFDWSRRLTDAGFTVWLAV